MTSKSQPSHAYCLKAKLWIKILTYEISSLGKGMPPKQKSSVWNRFKTGNIWDLASISHLNFKQSARRVSHRGLVKGSLKKPLRIKSLLSTKFVQKL
jgi:hypothetical protein